MINESQVYEEFEKALLEAIETYKSVEHINYKPIEIFIEDRVWDATIKYNRMMNVTKEQFFKNLYENTSIDEYTREIIRLWNIDHSYMAKSIEELNKMVLQKDFKDAEMYGDKKITTRSIKLENNWRDYKLEDKDLYELNPERDFKTLENRYVNRHIKLYSQIQDRYKDSKDKARDLANFMNKYDELDKTIPYFSHTTGDIRCYQTIATYLSMLYNVNLTRSAWNRTMYDAKLLGNNLFYLPAHTFACPHCMAYQGYVYIEGTPTPRQTNILMRYGKPGQWEKENAIDGGVGHPNCKHGWTLYFSPEQIQQEKYDSAEWEEKYKTQQKIQSLDLKKSKLLSDRRIYKELGQQDLYDKTTEKIKRIREKKKELEQNM